MSGDTFVQVAPDSTGKKINMGATPTLAGSDVVTQRTELVGSIAEALNDLLIETRLQTALLRAILHSFNSGTSEEDFL